MPLISPVEVWSESLHTVQTPVPRPAKTEKLGGSENEDIPSITLPTIALPIPLTHTKKNKSYFHWVTKL